MHSYQHNIKTFNNATRHLTRVERSLYRDLIELYYDTEQPLVSDIKKLQRLVIAQTEEEKEALHYVLDEFFELTGDVYTHKFCDQVIEAYRNNKGAKAAAGKASAAARKKKAEELKAARAKQNEQNSTTVQQPLDECSTNQKPETRNQKPINNKNNVADELALVSGYAFEGESFRVNQKDFLNHQKIYPNLDLLQEYQQLDIEVRDMAKKQRWGALNAKLNYRNKNSKRNQQPKISSMESALRHNAEYAAQLEREIEEEALTSHDKALAMP